MKYILNFLLSKKKKSKLFALISLLSITIGLIISFGLTSGVDAQVSACDHCRDVVADCWESAKERDGITSITLPSICEQGEQQCNQTCSIESNPQPYRPNSPAPNISYGAYCCVSGSYCTMPYLLPVSTICSCPVFSFPYTYYAYGYVCQ